MQPELDSRRSTICPPPNIIPGTKALDLIHATHDLLVYNLFYDFSGIELNNEVSRIVSILYVECPYVIYNMMFTTMYIIKYVCESNNSCIANSMLTCIT